MGYKPLIIIFILATQSVAQTTFDPLAIAVGARAMGMGKAYTAVAEEGDAIFTNPAGLGEIDSFQFTSMSTKLMEEVNYTMLGGVYPLGGRSALGFGYAAATVGGIELRNVYGDYLKKSDLSESVFLISYGRKLAEKLSLGVNLKYYSRSANELTDGNGSGLNLDVGLLQKGLGWFAFGVVGKNVLTSTRIRHQNGEEEALPSSVKVGTRMHIMGKEFESAIFSPVKLVAVADADLNLQGSRQTVTHAGIELSPIQNLTLRAGIDQDPTFGVTLRFAGLGFHYAYHPYAELDCYTAHYFTLSFDERGWPHPGPPDIFLGRNQ